LVVPIFFDPIFLISFFKNNFVKIKPNGIDPHRYEKIKTKNISVFTVS